MYLNYPGQRDDLDNYKSQGIGFVSSKKRGGISPKLRDLYTRSLSQSEAREGSTSHQKSVRVTKNQFSSHMEGSKQGGVEEKLKMTLPKS